MVVTVLIVEAQPGAANDIAHSNNNNTAAFATTIQENVQRAATQRDSDLTEPVDWLVCNCNKVQDLLSALVKPDHLKKHEISAVCLPLQHSHMNNLYLSLFTSIQLRKTSQMLCGLEMM